jgi:preprotein translocase subunit SecA
MFVDLMGDIHNTFTERFLRAQITFEQPRPLPPMFLSDDGSGENGEPRRGPAPSRRYNALGVLEDVVPGEESGEGTDATLDIAPAEAPKRGSAVRTEPTVHVGGKSSSLSKAMAGGPVPGVAGGPAGAKDWSNVGRNDPCPCGSGKKFKKCHGAAL